MSWMARRGFVALRDGGRLSYAVSPEADDTLPLLLLRPLGGSMTLWDELASALARHHRVIAFDPRGVGDSSAAPWRCSTRQMAHDARELLDALAVPRAHVFGLSLGGMVASWLAIDQPARVAHLILASTLPRPGSVSRRLFHHLGPLTRSLAHFARADSDAEVDLVRAILSPQFRRTQPARVRAIDAAVRQTPTSRRGLGQLALAAALHDAEARLGEIAAPTLLLTGALDIIAGAHSQSELLRDLPNARIIVIRDAGHDLSLEAPSTTAEHVSAFLGEARPRPHDTLPMA